MGKHRHVFVSLALGALLTACSPPGPAQQDTPAKAQAPRQQAASATSPAPPPAERAYTLVMLGDSLTAGLGLAPGEAFPQVVQHDLGGRVRIINAGVSGDTTKAGLDRFDWSVGPDADGVLIALGANDMLNGLDPAQTRANLAAMIEKARARGLDVYLAGMRASPNLGPDYARAFDALYPALAKRYCVPLFPFLLQPLATEDGTRIRQALIQPDGLHPTTQGAALIGHALADWLGKMRETHHLPCTPKA